MPALDRGDADLLRSTLAAVAPGTGLREGLERILRGNTGALIVLGLRSDGRVAVHRRLRARRGVLARPGCASWPRWTARSCSTCETSRIVRAAVQLVPDPTIPSEESGTRHRTAERVAKQTGLPVISVSQSMRIIALYVHGGALRRSRTPPRSCRGPTRPWPRWSATSCGSTRSPAHCPRWRSRTWSRCATWQRSPSGWRWSGASRARSTGTSSSSAPTAGC